MTFWAVLSRVMKHGSTNTNLKRSGKVHNGRLPIPQDQKNSNSPNQELLTCFYTRGIIHYEFVPIGQSIKFTIWKYWEGCVKKLVENDPNFLPTTHGSCITTMHVLTWHCL
jgi:hypothetical protein